jgi:tetratricopeptide (TPR) repeat protein
MSVAQSIPERALLEAAAATARGDHARAAALLETALANVRGRDRLPLLIRLGNASDELGRNEAALEAFRQALEIDPSSAAAWNNVGVICARIGRLEEAQQALEEARSHEPENADILVTLGSLALKRGDPGTALEALGAALDLESGHPLAHANRALTYAVFGRIEEAEESLRLAALYGFSGGQPIQDRIDRMKEVREATIREMARKAAEERLNEVRDEDEVDSDTDGDVA